jgi:hypothetical protein
VDAKLMSKNKNLVKKVEIRVWPSLSFIPSNKKLKLPGQPIHNRTNLKQAKLPQISTLLEKPNF